MSLKEYFYLGSAEKNQLGNRFESNQYDYSYNKDEIDINRKGDSHLSIVRAIEENSYVLDVGCASGNIGRLLKDFKNCKIDGIEIDEEAIEHAKATKAYNSIYNFSIMDEENEIFKKIQNSKNKYDYIVFGDVLEHLYDPYRALVNMSKFLKKNGKIIISLPNASHIDVIRSLINNEFNYNKLGLLDVTHIRFFTINSFQDMINNISANEKIYYSSKLVDKVIVPPCYYQKQKFYDLLNLDGKLEDYFVLQNIIELTKLDDKKNVKRLKYKDDDYFEKIIFKCDTEYNHMEEYKMIINSLNENIKNYDRRIKEMEKELKEKESEINEIVNSKRWKMLNKMLRIIGK